MYRILEGMVGIETYQIPQHHGNIILNVTLEQFDNIMTLRKSDPYKDGNGSKVHFTSVNFADSIIKGFIPAVQCFFIPKGDIMYSGLEYESLRLSRASLVTTNFIDRCLNEFEDIYKISEDPVNRINEAVERQEWEDRVSRKIYCIYQLHSCLKMIKDQDLPGEPIDFLLIPDLKPMNRFIKEMKDEIIELRKTHKNIIDDQYIYRTLHMEHINIYQSKAFNN